MALKFRRGTTAQKSGSLAFGEPYVNTTLGALQVGLESGDITIRSVDSSSAVAITSVSASTFLSASSLKVTGDASIDGNLTLGGTFQQADTGNGYIKLPVNPSDRIEFYNSSFDTPGFIRVAPISSGNSGLFLKPATNAAWTAVHARWRAGPVAGSRGLPHRRRPPVAVPDDASGG